MPCTSGVDLKWILKSPAATPAEDRLVARRPGTGPQRCSPALCDHHRDNGEGLRYARDLGDHSLLHDLGFNLPEAGLQASLTGALRDQYPGRTHQRIDDIADPKEELLHSAIDAGPNNRLIQIDLLRAVRRVGSNQRARPRAA
jgi:hypothetical protein